jgi:hypothetical protein
MKNRPSFDEWKLAAAGFVTLVLVFAWSSPLHAATAEDRLEREFTVEPGAKLVVDADRGGIEVRGGPGTTIKVVVDRKATAIRSATAQDVLRRHSVGFEQSGNRVEVRGRLAGRLLSGWLRRSNLQVRYQVLVPERCDVVLRTAGGAVETSQLAGTVEARTSGGSLTFRSIHGPITGRTAGGGIEATGIEGTVDVETSGGGIRLQDVVGDVHAGTAGGGIRVSRVRGQLKVRTSGGGITLERLDGPATAQTAGGSVQAEFSSAPMADCRLETSGGGITVTIPKQAAFTLDASTSGGRVTSELPVTVQGETKRSSLQGTVNGGGPRITARTAGGGIAIKAGG